MFCASAFILGIEAFCTIEFLIRIVNAFFPLSFIVISLSVCPSNVLVALFVRFRLTPSLFGVHCSLVWFNTHTLSLSISPSVFFLVIVNLLRAFWKVSCAYWLNEVDTASVQHVKYQWKKTAIAHIFGGNTF